MSECAIILEPLRPIYYPGDILSGYVFINLPKDKKVNKVTLEADGRASVKFTNKYDKHGSKHSAEKVYLEDHLTIWKKNKFQEERWDTIGNRKYPFSFVIPSDAAPTVECTYGFVRYRLKAELNLSWTLDKSFEVEVKVGVPINLESNPTYTQPQSSEILKSSLFSLSKSVLATVSIPRLVWTIGEVIPVFLDFNNDTSNNISMVEITTIKKEIYTGQAIHEKTCKVTKEFIKKLNPMKFNVNVPASASRDVQINVRVQDDSVTVTDCPIINVDYELEIKIHFKGIFASPLSTTLPVIFSSVPLVRSSSEVSMPEFHPPTVYSSSIPPSTTPSVPRSITPPIPSSIPRSIAPSTTPQIPLSIDPSIPPSTPRIPPSTTPLIPLTVEQGPVIPSPPIPQPTVHPDSPPADFTYASNPNLTTSSSISSLPLQIDSSHEFSSTFPTEYQKRSVKVTDL